MVTASQPCRVVEGRRSSSLVDVLTRLSVVLGLVGGSGHWLMRVRERERKGRSCYEVRQGMP